MFERKTTNLKIYMRILYIFTFLILVYSQTTNVCGNVDCSVIGSLKYENLCKKPTEITETIRNQICGSICSTIGCKSICNCKVYNVANCCYSGKQCTSDFVKTVCGSFN